MEKAFLNNSKKVEKAKSEIVARNFNIAHLYPKEVLDEIETPEDVIEKYDKLVQPLRLRFENYFYRDEEKLEQLRKPEIRELFDDLEHLLSEENQSIERDRELANLLSKDIFDIERRIEKGENLGEELARKQAEFTLLKQDYSQAVLDQALVICSNPDLNFDLPEKAVVLSHILERYHKYTAIEHCYGMCKDAEKLIESSFDSERLDFTLDVNEVRDELLEDIKHPDDNDLIDFILTDIENDPVIRYSELQRQLSESLNAKDIDDLVLKVNLGARLHNIGKMCIPLSLIDGGKVGKSQKAIIAEHVLKGEDILSQFDFPDEIKDMALYHHAKKPDYRKLLKTISRYSESSDIPIQAKLIEILDIYNAFTTPRSYRPYALPRLVALKLTKELIGDDQDYKKLYKLFLKYILNEQKK